MRKFVHSLFVSQNQHLLTTEYTLKSPKLAINILKSSPKK